MTSEEMANDEIKKQREKFVQEGINDSRLAQVEVINNTYHIFSST